MLDLRDRLLSTVATIVVLGATCTGSIAQCFPQPNVQAGQGGHWYYHDDPSSRRRCWYLQPPSKPAGSPSAQPSPTTLDAAGVSLLLSSFFADARPPVSSSPQPSAAIAATPTEQSAAAIAAMKGTTPAQGRRWALNARRTAGLTQLRRLGLRGTEEEHQLDPDQREVLFQQFLWWAAQQQ